MAITNTIGGSGSYAIGNVSGPVTLFTTPTDIDGNTNAIFMVYLTWWNNSSFNTELYKQQRIMVGPNTPVRIIDAADDSGQTVTWHYTGMVIQ